jgi:15-cis-phytoene synthase
MIALYNKVCHEASRVTTFAYSTSFSTATKLLHRDFHEPICGIYGFVRFADEIVDTFHEHDKKILIAEFRRDTYLAIERGISMNPILHSFQEVVNKYSIERDLIDAFLHSMEMDLEKQDYYTQEDLKTYVYGSAEVVGLMCLRVFVEGDTAEYNKLRPFACALGSAFQKVNFLRDLNADKINLERSYFPEITGGTMNDESKSQIEQAINEEFMQAKEGIKMLPAKARFGVYVAFKYYYSLFKKIRSTEPDKIMEQRIRIPNLQKLFIVLKSSARYQMNML